MSDKLLGIIIVLLLILILYVITGLIVLVDSVKQIEEHIKKWIGVKEMDRCQRNG